MAKYKKKPVVIEAEQWEGLHSGNPDVTQYVVDNILSRCEICGNPMAIHGQINTLEGTMRVCPNDWVITGVDGEKYACKDSIFKKTYVPFSQRKPYTPKKPRPKRKHGDCPHCKKGKLEKTTGLAPQDDVEYWICPYCDSTFMEHPNEKQMS